MARNLLGQLLLAAGVIDEAQLEEGLKLQERTGKRLGEVLVELGFATESQILQALEEQIGIPFIDLKHTEIDPEAVKSVPASIVSRYKLLPVKQEDGAITVAIADPLNLYAIDELRLLLGQDVHVVIASSQDISDAIKRFYGVGADTVERLVRSGDAPIDISEETQEIDLETMAEDASIVRFVNQIILEAFHSGATDIHIEPFEDDLRIRYRIDGVLHEANTPPALKRFQSPIVSRIKIMAGLDIAEKRRPQDGRIKVRIGGEDLDLRVSVIPTLFGESVNIRLLGSRTISLEELGLDEKEYKIMLNLIHKPHGIILVTGPTGCGKTTTLYAALSKINSVDKKIITIEDPIEYQLKGVNQMQVQPKIGLTFAEGLRSILRQDPDVIMVGEIRDYETAEIAIRAALTGHLVFSTLHTNDAPSGVTRLLDMGIEPYLVASSVEAIIAQRLVRVICPNCRTSYKMSAESLRELGFPAEEDMVLQKGAGCDECRNTGYKGRTAIFEILLMTEPIKELVLNRASASQIRERAVAEGMKTLVDAGWDKVKAGITTVEEVLRVAEAQEGLS